MNRGFICLWVLILGLWALAVPPWAADTGERPCREGCAAWKRIFDDLQSKADELRRVKEDSVGPRIRELMSESTHRTLAKVVRTALDERRQRLQSARRSIEQIIVKEKEAFSSCRRCMTAASGKRNALESLPRVSQRKDLLGDIPSLLLAEAFFQYRDESPRRVNSNRYQGNPYSSRAGYWNAGQRGNAYSGPPYYRGRGSGYRMPGYPGYR